MSSAGWHHAAVLWARQGISSPRCPPTLATTSPMPQVELLDLEVVPLQSAEAPAAVEDAAAEGAAAPPPDDGPAPGTAWR